MNTTATLTSSFHGHQKPLLMVTIMFIVLVLIGGAAAEGGWLPLPGLAKDIGVGADGSAWVIGTNATGGGYGIYQWNGSNWNSISGGAVRIDVGPDGTVWVVNSYGKIYRRAPGSGFQQLPGRARDIGVGADGSAWVIGTNAVYGGYDIYQWNGSNWQVIDGGAVEISVGPDGTPWIVDSNSRIKRQGLFLTTVHQMDKVKSCGDDYKGLPLDERFDYVNDDETVFVDRGTCVMWSTRYELLDGWMPVAMSYNEAWNACSDLNLGGYDDWSLPFDDQLEYFVETSPDFSSYATPWVNYHFPPFAKDTWLHDDCHWTGGTYERCGVWSKTTYTSATIFSTYNRSSWSVMINPQTEHGSEDEYGQITNASAWCMRGGLYGGATYGEYIDMNY